jgi:hypothetical protein
VTLYCPIFAYICITIHSICLLHFVPVLASLVSPQHRLHVMSLFITSPCVPFAEGCNLFVVLQHRIPLRPITKRQSFRSFSYDRDFSSQACASGCAQIRAHDRLRLRDLNVCLFFDGILFGKLPHKAHCARSRSEGSVNLPKKHES